MSRTPSLTSSMSTSDDALNSVPTPPLPPTPPGTAHADMPLRPDNNNSINHNNGSSPSKPLPVLSVPAPSSAPKLPRLDRIPELGMNGHVLSIQVPSSPTSARSHSQTSAVPKIATTPTASASATFEPSSLLGPSSPSPERPRRSPRPAAAHLRPKSSAHSRHPTLGFSDVFSHAGALSYLLDWISWTDYLVLTKTCRSLRSCLFDAQDVQHVVLSRFVPGFRDAFAAKGEHWSSDVPVSLEDLQLLAISESLPLHSYPTHALVMMSSSSPPTPELYSRTELYALLSASHSRFVLLLQSLVHSAPSQQRQYQGQDIDEALPRFPSYQHQHSQHTLKHLSFPAPLYYTGPDAVERPPLRTLPSLNNSSANTTGKNSGKNAQRPSLMRLASQSMSSLPQTGGRNPSVPAAFPWLDSPSSHHHMPTLASTSSRAHLRKHKEKEKQRAASSSGGRGRDSSHNRDSSFLTSSAAAAHFATLPRRPGPNVDSKDSKNSKDSSNSKPKRSSSKSSSRFSTLLGRSSRVPFPPPLPEPAALRAYSGGWRALGRSEEALPRPSRRRFASTSMDMGRRSPGGTGGAGGGGGGGGSGTSTPSGYGSGSDVSIRGASSGAQAFTPVYGNGYGYGYGYGHASPHGSAYGSAPGLAGPGTGTGTPYSYANSHGGGSASYVPPLPNQFSQSSLSPHDLLAARRRTRAPVLRVFVPTAARDGGAADRSCERELRRRVLWGLMSVGDVVVNVGCVPERTQTQAQAQGQGQEQDDDGEAMVFDGRALVPLKHGPRQPIPIWSTSPTLANGQGRGKADGAAGIGGTSTGAEPTALPSPFYYAHVLPSLQDPVWRMRVPSHAFVGSGPPVMALVDVKATIDAPGAPGGRVAVIREVWMARVRVGGGDEDEAGSLGGAHVGDGWRGTWTLESAGGTREAKALLEEALKGTRAMSWVVVREKCRAPRKDGEAGLWFRMVEDEQDQEGSVDI